MPSRVDTMREQIFQWCFTKHCFRAHTIHLHHPHTKPAWRLRPLRSPFLAHPYNHHSPTLMLMLHAHPSWHTHEFTACCYGTANWPKKRREEKREGKKHCKPTHARFTVTQTLVVQGADNRTFPGYHSVLQDCKDQDFQPTFHFVPHSCFQRHTLFFAHRSIWPWYTLMNTFHRAWTAVINFLTNFVELQIARV